MRGSFLGRVVVILLLLVVEVVMTLAVYTALNLYAFNTFGWLVRLSSAVLDGMRGLLLALMPGSANQAYATLLGELGPKAILLLLLGLVVAAVMRALVEVGGSRHRHS